MKRAVATPEAPADDDAAPPIYVASGRRGQAWAHFGSGDPILVHSDRRRAYPGLTCEAPPTGPFYAAASSLFDEGALVLDVGSGAGIGARMLSARVRVVGIDADADAVAFSTRYAPSARFVESDLTSPPELTIADGAVVIDVLGMARDPAVMLRSVRHLLPEGARVLVAEPVAHASQWLRHPARRAFTRPELCALLLASGFDVEVWVEAPGSFHCCVARAGTSEAWRWLGEAERHLGGGSPELALGALARAGASPQPEIEVARAKAHMSRGDGDAAFGSIVRVREMAPHDARGHALMARLALAAGASDQALELAIEAVRCDGCSVVAQTVAADVTEQLGGDAYDGWRTAANLAPSDLGVVTRLAQCAAARQDHALAISVLERARTYGDDLGPAFHVTLGWLLVADDRPDDARLEARLVLARAPADADALELLAHLGAAG